MRVIANFTLAAIMMLLVLVPAYAYEPDAEECDILEKAFIQDNELVVAALKAQKAILLNQMLLFKYAKHPELKKVFESNEKEMDKFMKANEKRDLNITRKAIAIRKAICD